MRELFIYQERKGFVSLFIPQDKESAEQVPLIRGAEKGGHGVTETDATRANNYLGIKACIGLKAVHIGGAVPFFDSSSANFPLCDAGVHDDIVRGA